MSDHADLAPLAGLSPQASRWKRSLGYRQMANISLGTKYVLSISKSEVFWGRVRVVTKKGNIKVESRMGFLQEGRLKHSRRRKQGAKREREGHVGPSVMAKLR